MEPETLLLWSLVTYFERWYTVHVGANAEAALAVLERQRVDALIVAGELPDDAADRITARALEGNPNVIAVRTIADTSTGRASAGCGASIEKPFRLSELAEILQSRAQAPRIRR